MAPRACIIGAGASGISVAQVLQAKGIDFDWFEMGSQIGGMWRYDNDNGVSSAYRSLHINTSREAMQYAAFPMPADLPDYPSHWQIAAYFDDFVDHFGLRDKISFGTEVVKVALADGSDRHAEGEGRYVVTLRGRELREPETRSYDHVIVCNGHHWHPRWPEPSFPGSEDFPGTQIHSHYYRTPDLLEGKRVVVLGIGNSAADIAVESSRVARATYLAMRRGAHVVPKYLFGVPTDHLTDSPLARGPVPLQKLGLKTLLRLAIGKVTDYGLPEPDHDVLEAHPTVSDDLLTRLGHGDITIKPSIARFDGSEVEFTDGSRVEADVVVYCTGYQISFPFLAESLVSAEANHVDLYHRVVSPDHEGLYFLGLIQPIGSIIPLAEEQAHWVAELIAGEVTLPSPAEMRDQIAAYDDRLRRRYVASKRHTIQVDAHAYRTELRKERRTRRVDAPAGRRLRLPAAVAGPRRSS